MKVNQLTVISRLVERVKLLQRHAASRTMVNSTNTGVMQLNIIILL